jgi:thiol-disulfide isomerase/thioredoxin
MRRALLLVLLCLPLSFAGVAAAVQVGQMAPNFKGASLGGGAPIELSSLRGKVVYLDFWASWCAPCRISLPLLNGMRVDLARQGFEVLGVNLDTDPSFAKKLMEAWGVQYPVVNGLDEKVYLEYGIKTMPMAYILDRKGQVRIVHQGFRKSDFPALRAQIEKLVREETQP